MATFMLRRIDDLVWRQFRAIAAAQHLPPDELLKRIIAAYVTDQNRRAQGPPASSGEQ